MVDVVSLGDNMNTSIPAYLHAGLVEGPENLVMDRSISFCTPLKMHIGGN